MNETNTKTFELVIEVPGFDFEQVFDEFRCLNLPEDGEVLDHQLGADLYRIELEQIDLSVFHEIRDHLVR